MLGSSWLPGRSGPTPQMRCSQEGAAEAAESGTCSSAGLLRLAGAARPPAAQLRPVRRRAGQYPVSGGVPRAADRAAQRRALPLLCAAPGRHRVAAAGARRLIRGHVSEPQCFTRTLEWLLRGCLPPEMGPCLLQAPAVLPRGGSGFSVLAAWAGRVGTDCPYQRRLGCA